MLVPDYAETDTDSNNEDREDNIPQGDDNSTSYNNVQNDNIDHDNRPSTSAESDVNYHNRASGFDSVAGERANSPVEHVMSEPTDMMLDDVHDNGNAAKRRDSDSTIIYDPVDFECGIKRVRHDSTDSPVELDDDSRQASKYARVDRGRASRWPGCPRPAKRPSGQPEPYCGWPGWPAIIFHKC